ncbi:hypothetical protein EJ04DRAFT_468499 [Polyplosphaeria fusca]|uniref:Alpha-type protein kinase domain-containing protein n=1 Tax=Polyplosphaeria fusca TaxID=682080 RepID=A0A9P4QV91_9PLEO|nr:hypothetical protein EJ04DRAFT_468499 [Polyplosphaeria fusca]
MESSVAKARSTVRPLDSKGVFRAHCSADVLFLIDTTYSMQPYIDAAKDQVYAIISGIETAFLGDSTVRVAVVGYKDHGDSPNIEFLDFTSSLGQARDFLGKLSAAGGDDFPEDVLGGLWQATTASWTQPTRCIFHIADAPGHSRALHDLYESEDYYYTPGTEPHGLTYAPIVQNLVELGVDYTFFHIAPHTDRMLSAFSRVYQAAGADSKLLPSNKYHGGASGASASSKAQASNSPRRLFQELHLGTDTASLKHLVMKSVTESVTRTSTRLTLAIRPSNRSHIPGDEPAAANLETALPQWSSPTWFDKKADLEGFCPEVVVYSNSTLADMMHSDDHIKLSFAQLTLNSRSKPFGQGAQRLASYARVEASDSHFVVKSFASRDDCKGMEHQIEDMRAQALCKAFALEFNGLMRPEKSIDFIVTACLQTKADAAAGRREGCLSLEPHLPGDYVKYNNNAMYVNEDLPDDHPVNAVAQAFSHFTFERSWGHFMVVDLQGVGNLLTDPVIHTKDPERFKLNDLNMSTEGFKFFFVSHQCNHVCRELGLISDRDMAASGNYRFRERWPALEPTLCCSNKLCQSIIRLSDAKKSPKFPGYHWCDVCWPELQSSTAQWICTAPGDTHRFDVSRFFYVSQGKLPPQQCLAHVEKDANVSSAATVGGGLWALTKNESRRSLVLGNEH